MLAGPAEVNQIPCV